LEALLKTPLVDDSPKDGVERLRLGFGAGPKARLLERIARSLDDRAPGTYGHSHRVGLYAGELARGIGLSWAQTRRVRRAGAIHDIGKTGVPGEILNKPRPLTEEELERVEQHAEIGAEMVAQLGDPELTAIVRHHHEHFDGGGYPDGLAGAEIPLGARIIAVCDTFDALTTKRPYRDAIGFPEALGVLDELAGSQLDPTLVARFDQRFAGVWAA
jgi:putative nucleotidyltransferase with HDIG domain